MSDIDHIIVGSGINALVCAAMLGGKGAKVLVLERNDRIGGCMRTEEITAPGFIHDVMATTFVLFITSPAYAALGKDLARHGLEFCNTSTPTGVLRPDGSHAVLRTDRTANVAAINAIAAGDGDRHGSDVGEIERNAGPLFGLLGGNLWSYPTARLLAG
ncbi:NAD(P)-binding protein, partial [Mesorhizobium sp.]|uniref:phytoene desaturase family protein n=1 Tax=Mesorhizobium sp. TaxID=1871066 RepID=UPI0025D5CE4A